jgi:hypothetical protein
MPRWQETLIISSGLLKKVYGQSHALNASGEVHVAVWPQTNSGGPKAEFVIMRPMVNLNMAVDETAGIGASVLAPVFHTDTNYAFPLHPEADTLSFKATADTGNVELNWIVVR